MKSSACHLCGTKPPRQEQQPWSAMNQAFNVDNISEIKRNLPINERHTDRTQIKIESQHFTSRRKSAPRYVHWANMQLLSKLTLSIPHLRRRSRQTAEIINIINKYSRCALVGFLYAIPLLTVRRWNAVRSRELYAFCSKNAVIPINYAECMCVCVCRGSHSAILGCVYVWEFTFRRFRQRRTHCGMPTGCQSFCLTKYFWSVLLMCSVVILLLQTYHGSHPNISSGSILSIIWH